MASSKAAWGIEVGAGAVKAIRLERSGSSVTVTDFAFIEHKKVLTTPDLDQNEVIRLSLGQLISQKNFENERIVMSVPGHSALARFAKLPPVEPKKIPDIVKFEAVQQIPFPIDQVEWDYQTFATPDSPEVEVGIFAITKEKVADRLTLYTELGLQPEIVTLSPLSVYNAACFDLDSKPEKPTVILDIGTSASDLIVAYQGRCWVRTFPLGGHHFTEALEQAFSLSYSKAERLKQESATSQYAKQMMQAMRPVFGDLLQEVQRSLGHFQTLNREAQVDSILGLGSTFKIPGLRKFLGQQLQVDVVRLDEFKKIRVEGREAADFAAHCVNFATAYGLALQGVGLGTIEINLSPVRNIREKLWTSKTRWFGAAAALAVIAGAALTVRPLLERVQMPGALAQVTRVKSQAKSFVDQYKRLESESDVGFVAENMKRLLDDRNIWPHLVRDCYTSLLSSKPSGTELESTDFGEIMKLPADQRNLIVLENLGGKYELKGDKRLIHVTMAVAFAERGQAASFLNSTAAEWLRKNADRPDVPYRILVEGDSPSVQAGPVGGGPPKAAGATGGDGFNEPPAPVSGDGDSNSASPAGSGGSDGFRRRTGGGGIERGDSMRGIQIGTPTATKVPDQPVADDTTQRRRNDEDDESLKDIDSLAPIPGLPDFFSNVKFHRGVVRFTVELRPKQAPAPAGGAA